MFKKCFWLFVLLPVLLLLGCKSNLICQPVFSLAISQYPPMHVAGSVSDVSDSNQISKLPEVMLAQNGSEKIISKTKREKNPEKPALKKSRQATIKKALKRNAPVRAYSEKDFKIKPWHVWALGLLGFAVMLIIPTLIIGDSYNYIIQVMQVLTAAFVPLAIAFSLILFSVRQDGKINWYALIPLIFLLNGIVLTVFLEGTNGLYLLLFILVLDLIYSIIAAIVMVASAFTQQERFSKAEAVEGTEVIADRAKNSLKKIGHVFLFLAILMLVLVLVDLPLILDDFAIILVIIGVDLLFGIILSFFSHWFVKDPAKLFGR